MAPFTCLISRSFQQYFSLTINQQTILSTTAFQADGSFADCGMWITMAGGNGLKLVWLVLLQSISIHFDRIN
jgi:hypothetical protein